MTIEWTRESRTLHRSKCGRFKLVRRRVEGEMQWQVFVMTGGGVAVTQALAILTRKKVGQARAALEQLLLMRELSTAD